MNVIGLTGGIGMGKTTAARWLAAQGIAVVDTDDLARAVVQPGQPALAEIQALFGASVVDAEGGLRREELARVVFGDAARRRQLEEIVHPRIRERWLAQLQAWRQEGRSLAVVVIPLLFETGAGPEFDRIVCMACSAPSQAARLGARGWTPAQIEQRNAAQWPVQKKMDLAHHMVWTEPGEEVQHAQWRRILEQCGWARA